MSEFFGFIGTIIKLLFLAAIVVAVIAVLGYNKLRRMAEGIREAWSNIGVVGKKQVSLINQLIDVVKGFQESEKLVMLKVSEDLSTASSIAQMHQQSGMVLSAVSGMAQRFPELKANEQYRRLIDSIQGCESQLEQARQLYNGQVRTYNSHRSSLPTVLYATAVGFKAAPYLEFVGTEQTTDLGSIKDFSSDADGERVTALLGAAGSSAKRLGASALAGGKLLVDAATDKVQKFAEEQKSRAPVVEQTYTYLDKDGNPAGPVTVADLHKLIAQSLIDGQTRLLATGGKEWIRYGQLAEAATSETPPPPPQPAASPAQH